jgi:hypothetical protein
MPHRQNESSEERSGRGRYRRYRQERRRGDRIGERRLDDDLKRYNKDARRVLRAEDRLIVDENNIQRDETCLDFGRPYQWEPRLDYARLNRDVRAIEHDANCLRFDEDAWRRQSQSCQSCTGDRTFSPFVGMSGLDTWQWRESPAYGVARNWSLPSWQRYANF